MRSAVTLAGIGSSALSVLVLAALAGLGCAADDSGCSPPADQPTATAELAPSPPPALDSEENALLDALVAFMRDPGDRARFDDVPFADDVGLGLGGRLYATRPAGELRAPAPGSSSRPIRTGSSVEVSGRSPRSSRSRATAARSSGNAGRTPGAPRSGARRRRGARRSCAV